MKKKYLFSSDTKKWNALVRNFINLYKRINTGNSSDEQMFRITKKLQKIYNQLEKLQYRVGIKLAGTALAFMLTSAVCYSQTYNYTYTGNLKGYPACP